MAEMVRMVRIRSTFAPRVCIGCHWEAKYIELKRLHTALRANLMKLNGGKRSRVERDEEERDESPDLVDLIHVQD